MRAAEKTLWLLFVLFAPFLGAFVYLIANSDDMARRGGRTDGRATGPDGRVRPVGRRLVRCGGEIEKAKGLLESGAINQQEYDAIKAKALA